MLLSITGHKKRASKKVISPEFLEEQLKRQKEIGEVGERIAIDYEISRLKLLGVNYPDKHIQQVSLLNSASGFDIRSSHKKK